MTETVTQAVATPSTTALVAEILEGPDAGKSARGDGEAITIGTASGNTLVLTDPAVSRFHIEIAHDRHGLMVIDHRSTNGTWLGNVRVVSAAVPPGSVLRIGNTMVKVGEVREEVARGEVFEGDRLGGLVGRSQVMRRVMARIEKLAPSARSSVPRSSTDAPRAIRCCSCVATTGGAAATSSTSRRWSAGGARTTRDAGSNPSAWMVMAWSPGASITTHGETQRSARPSTKMRAPDGDVTTPSGAVGAFATVTTARRWGRSRWMSPTAVREHGLRVRGSDAAREVAVDHGQVAVVPFFVATAPARPHVTSQSTQFVTMQPAAGHVTLQSSLPPQSTLHDEDELHSTWQSALFVQVTSTSFPGAPWMLHVVAPSAHVCSQSSVQTQLSPLHVSASLLQPTAVNEDRARKGTRNSFMPSF